MVARVYGTSFVNPRIWEGCYSFFFASVVFFKDRLPEYIRAARLLLLAKIVVESHMLVLIVLATANALVG